MTWKDVQDSDLLPTRTNADTNSAADINQVGNLSKLAGWFRTNINILKGGSSANPPTDDMEGLNSRLTAVEAGAPGIHILTNDYTILDNDGYGLFECNPSARAFTVTLPTAAANTNRLLKFKITAIGGAVTVDGNGAETIDGDATFILQGKNDYLEIYCNGTEWKKTKWCSTIETGWINNSDWTDRNLGTSEVNYDNLSGTFIIGETVTEATSGNTGVILLNAGGKLTLKNVTGTGIFTNNRVLTGGTSTATADVNEPSGNNKNANTDITHNLNKNFHELEFIFMVYSSASFTGAYRLGFAQADINSGSHSGYNTIQVNANLLRIITTSIGILYYVSGANFNQLDGTTDWYYNIIIRNKN